MSGRDERLPVRPELASWMLRELPGLAWLAAALWGHRWLAAGVWLGITAVAAAWICWLPGVWQAEAIVLVESHRVPPQLVPASVESDLEGRLIRARQKALASAELQAAIRKLNLYAEQRRGGASEDALAAELRRSLMIVPVDPGARGQLGPFRVVYRGPGPELAARVANYVAERFIAEASAERRFNPGVAAQFLGTRVERARQQLEEREASVRAYRLEHSEELPEQAEALRGIARNLRADLDGYREEIEGLEREQAALEQAERAAMAAPAAAPLTASPPTDDGAQPASPSGASRAEEIRKRLAALLAVYTPDYPDVRRLRAELAQAQSQDAATAARAPAAPHPNGVKPEPAPASAANGRIRERLSEIEERLQALATRRTQLAAELGLAEERLQRIPLHQQELATLTREHAFFNEQFLSVAARHQSAEIAAALERSYPSERLSILDPARPPEDPLGPRRDFMLGAASLGGLLLGCLLALARSLDPAWWGTAERSAVTEPEAEGRSYITA